MSDQSVFAGGASAAGAPALTHGGARLALVLGVVGLVSVLLCVTLPLAVCGPIGWWQGVRARRHIDVAPPGTWANRSSATAGIVLGVITSVLAVLLVGLLFVLINGVGGDWSLV